MDFTITHALNALLARNDALEDPLSWYASASQVLFAAALVAMLAVFATRRQALIAAIATPIALTAGALLAILVHRARPFAADPGEIHRYIAHAADSGFPSDHATAAFAIATAIALGHRRLGALALIAAAALALARVAVGVHWPSDVLAGAAIGAVTALAVTFVWRRVEAGGHLPATLERLLPRPSRAA